MLRWSDVECLLGQVASNGCDVLKILLRAQSESYGTLSTNFKSLLL
jgi:hypothetical protein